MAKEFITESFLLHNKPGKHLYEGYAKNVPIFDYHCHLPVRDIALNRQFEEITELWLAQDHYKWRAMRTNGIDEHFITGNAGSFEKFQAWACTVPNTIRNPLYHWSHMELRTFFGINNKLLGPSTAKEIYKACNDVLRADKLSVWKILRKMRVRVLSTTDDPVDDLEYHKKLSADSSFTIKVVPTFRSDPALRIWAPRDFNLWVSKLGEAANVEIQGYADFIEALKKRHDYFHEHGCRISDRGIEYPYAENYTEKAVAGIFRRVMIGENISQPETLKFKSAIMDVCTAMDAKKGWVQQLHIGALRNNNTRYMKLLGSDSGFDCIGDYKIAGPLVHFLDRHDTKGTLPKTVLFTINPSDNEMVVSVMGSFQDGPVPGKLQFGPGWWFNDTKEGMIRQMNALSNLGLLSRFIGMTTDSRSFLSFIRHDYFRRVLCSLLGKEIDCGELPDDIHLLGGVVNDICYKNAVNYFGIK
jgi:glucuronate isomerase